MTGPQTRVLRAVIDLYERDGRVTYNSLVPAIDGMNRSTIFNHVQTLIRDGFVEQEVGTQGTMRPRARPRRWVPLLKIEAT